MPNFHTGTINAEAPTNVLIGTSSTTVSADNPNRVGLILTNLASGTIYLGINNAPTLNAGIVILPDGGSWSMDEFNFTTQTIAAIAHSANSILSVQHFIR